MKLQDQKWNKCPTCERNTTVLQEQKYGCDQCKKEIDLNKKGIEYLDMTIFHHHKETEHLQYCSWKCCLKQLPKIKSDYFINLPFLTFDNQSKGLQPKDFLAHIKSIK